MSWIRSSPGLYLGLGQGSSIELGVGLDIGLGIGIGHRLSLVSYRGLIPVYEFCFTSVRLN